MQQDHRHTVAVLQQQVSALEDQTSSQRKREERLSPEHPAGRLGDRDFVPTSVTEKQRPVSLGSDSVFRERQQAEVGILPMLAMVSAWVTNEFVNQGMDQLELESLTLTTPVSFVY